MKTTLNLILPVLLCCMTIACKDKAQKTLTFMELHQEAQILHGVSIGAPKKVKNLSLFMLTGNENVKGRRYRILSEAMEKGKVTVKETGAVDQLIIDNNGDDYVFIHSGDIVKGGKQDRTIAYDIIVPPRSKNVPLQSFCVEQGRWEQRADEVVVAFGSNSKMLSSKDLKLAAKHEKNQGRVWDKVSEQQAYLNEKLSAKKGYTIDVSDNESDTSLQLALENEELKKAKDEYYEVLKDLINTPNTLGYAYAINGEIHGVEIYNNTQLLMDLWEKLLESIIVEAIGKEGESTHTSKTRKDVLDFMNTTEHSGKITGEKLNRSTYFETLEKKDRLLVFTTKDLELTKWIHKSYMQIDASKSLRNQ